MSAGVKGDVEVKLDVAVEADMEATATSASENVGVETATPTRTHEFAVGESLVLEYSDAFRDVTSKLSFPQHRHVTVHTVVHDSPETYYVLCNDDEGHMICVDVRNYVKHGCNVRRPKPHEVRHTRVHVKKPRKQKEKGQK